MDGNSFCPNCNTHGLEDSGEEIKCKNCGYTIQRLIKKHSHVPLHRTLFEIFLRSPIFVIYFAPILVYSVILVAVCFFITEDVGAILSLNLYKDNLPEIISKMILYIVVLLALMELTQLIYKQYSDQAFNLIAAAIRHGNLDVEFADDTPLDKLKNNKIYTIKMITLAVIFILMHVFYMLFDKDISMESAMLIFGCMFGSAAILIAIGLWEKEIFSEK